MKRIFVLGGGTGGTLAANRLRRMFSSNGASVGEFHEKAAGGQIIFT